MGEAEPAVAETVYEEADVPERYLSSGAPLPPAPAALLDSFLVGCAPLGVPTLVLDEFSLSDASQLRHLDALEGAPGRRRGSTLVAQGVLRLPGDAGAADEGVLVRLPAVTDWGTDLTRAGGFLVKARPGVYLP